MLERINLLSELVDTLKAIQNDKDGSVKLLQDLAVATKKHDDAKASYERSMVQSEAQLKEISKGREELQKDQRKLLEDRDGVAKSLADIHNTNQALAKKVDEIQQREVQALKALESLEAERTILESSWDQLKKKNKALLEKEAAYEAKLEALKLITG